MTAPATAAVCEVRDLRVRFGAGPGAVEALAGASLLIARGEICALVGRSGSGKSTLAHAVLGLLPKGGRIVAGSISFDGRRIEALPERRQRRLRGRRLALIPQDPFASLNPLARVGAQLRETLTWVAGVPRAAATARAGSLLEEVGLADADRVLAAYPHQLSGGMAQRVAIALALATRPELVIADEPTAALDPGRAVAILDLLATRAGGGDASVLLITHDLAAAGRIADRVAVIDTGYIVEHGPAGELLARPRHRITQALVAASRPAPGAARRGLERRTARPAKAAATTPLLRLEHVGVAVRHRAAVLGPSRYRPILTDVCLEVSAGETVAVTGPSGGGKSTLAAAIVGLLQPTSGRVLLDGRDLVAKRRAAGRVAGREVQLVFQDYAGSLNPSWRVGASVAEPILAHGLADGWRAARARATELLERVGLDASLAEALPRELSGGQKQRVALARALAAQPRLVILDEVTSALDVTTRAEILALLERLRADGGPDLLVISHDPVVVRRLADRVVRVAEGRLSPAEDPLRPSRRSPAQPSKTPALAGACSAAPDPDGLAVARGPPVDA